MKVHAFEDNARGIYFEGGQFTEVLGVGRSFGENAQRVLVRRRRVRNSVTK